MLVLSRVTNESIMIGDDIEVTVTQVRGEKVRIGITAPMTIAIHRKEVWESIKGAARSAKDSKKTQDAPLEGFDGIVKMSNNPSASIYLNKDAHGTQAES